jgi:hypothetical protein
MEDWIRFAQWVKRSSKTSGCFGDYVRAAMSTQIALPGTPGNPKPGELPTQPVGYTGYGYLTWTDNRIALNTAGAMGGGGQTISWHKDSDRMVVVFSYSYSGAIELVRDWNRISR